MQMDSRPPTVAGTPSLDVPSDLFMPGRRVDFHNGLENKRVLVVGVNFRPEITGIGPYTTDVCTWLAGQGASVQVLTGLPHYPSWSVAPEYRSRTNPCESYDDGVRVTRVRHYVPDEQTALRRSAFELSFALSTLRASGAISADVVLAVTPSLGALPAAVSVARRNRAPLGVIVQDLLGRAAVQSGIARGRALAHVATRLEAYWLARADLVGVVSRHFETVLAGAGIDRSRVVHLPNHSRLDVVQRDAAAARHALGWADDALYVVHTGNMGLKQDLANVIEAARLSEEHQPKFRFVLVGDGSQRAALERLASAVPSVTLLPAVPERDYPTVLAAADVLLVNERPTVKDMSLASKITSYLATGRPIVAAARADSATAHQVLSSGAGLVVRPGDPRALAESLHSLASDAELRDRLADNGRAYCRVELSAHAAQTRLLQFVHHLTERPK
jgi:putative colanic acid biosynthesis glycosyltransferase WcaI